MTANELPANPKDSQYGWPKPARLDEFSKLLAKTGQPTYRVVFQGKNQDVRIIRVPIELPKYRLTNGRTASLQQEYMAKQAKTREDFFTGDPEMLDSQEVQHNLLLQVARQSDLQKFFEDTANRQVEPLLLDEYGIVVNGNRRLSCWRHLLQKDSAKYGHFRHIDVAVLPHADEKELDRLEATLQIQKDIRADYSWDAQANMMLAKQRRDRFSNKELADLYGMKESEVRELLDMRAYADEYLRTRGKANLWSLVSDGGNEYAFRKISTSRPKVAGVGNQELFKQAAFAMIEKPEEAGGRLYEVIPAIAESVNEVKARLQDAFEVKPLEDSKELDDLFGGVVPDDGTTPIDLPLAKEIQKEENLDLARKIIAEVVETQKQLKLDEKTAFFLFDRVTAAHTQLAAAVKAGLRAESSTRGVAKQLDQIEFQVKQIRAFLSKHADN